MILNDLLKLVLKKTEIALICMLIAFNTFSEIDTLRHYNPLAADANTSSSYALVVNRFEPAAPGNILAIMIKVGGTSSSGSFVLHLYGHEAGTSFPQLTHDIITPVTLNKTVSGTQTITYELPQPVFIDNNQFFIGISGVQTGVTIISSNETATATCTSSDGGDYYFQFYKSAAGTWYLGTYHSFKIDVIIDYSNISSTSYLTDETASAGISTALSNTSVAATDYNNDGFTDLLISGQLYKNNGNETYTNVTQSSGLTGSSSGNAFVDIDNDNDLDILYIGWVNSLFVNDGTNHFTQHNISLPNLNALHGFAIADINNDNFPDLFVCQLWNSYPVPEPNYLFINDGNYNFTDNTAMLYPDYDGTYNFPNAAWIPAQYIYEKNRNSRGCSWVDYDNDGDPDLFITNYFLQEDEFFRNNGDGTFTDICQEKGIDVNQTGSNHGTGTDWADYDNDGDMDLLLSQFAHPAYMLQYDHRGTTIYRNEGSPDYNFFDTHGLPSNPDGDNGIEFEETHAGSAWGDINNDGLMDFIITTYYGCRYIDIYIQKPDHTFELKTFDYGIENIVSGTDANWFDFNNDGNQDIGGADHGVFRLWKNNNTTNNFVSIKLKSTSGNSFAIGSKIKVYAAGQVYTQEVNCGRGQKMQRPYEVHFGLGEAQIIDSVNVYWYNSTMEHFTGLLVNHHYILTEGGNIEFAGHQVNANLLTVNYPVSGCGFTNNEHFSVNIVNMGYDTLYSFSLSLYLNGNFICTENIVDTILPSGTYTYIFNNSVDLSLTGVYSALISLSALNDEDLSNNTISDYVIYNGPIVSLGNNLSICSGQSVVFDAANVFYVNYLWSDGATTSSITANQSGIYSVTVTDNCGNSVSAQVSLTVNPNPDVELGNYLILENGEPVIIDAGNSGSNFLWSTGETTQSISVDSPDTYYLTVTNSFGCSSTDNIIVYPDYGIMNGDFENIIDFSTEMEGWTLIDGDLSPTYEISLFDFPHETEALSFIVFNPASLTPAIYNMTPHSGNRFGACIAALPASEGGNAPNNDWIISPLTTLGENPVVSFWVKTYSSQYGLERYRVGVSNTNTDISDFTIISQGEYQTAPSNAWTKVTYDLSAFQNQSIYFGINCVSDDSWIFMLDDIEFSNGSIIHEDQPFISVSIFPKPAFNVLNIVCADHSFSDYQMVNVLGQSILTGELQTTSTKLNVSELPDGLYYLRLYNNSFTSKNFPIIIQKYALENIRFEATEDKTSYFSICLKLCFIISICIRYKHK